MNTGARDAELLRGDKILEYNGAPVTGRLALEEAWSIQGLPSEIPIVVANRYAGHVERVYVAPGPLGPLCLRATILRPSLFGRPHKRKTRHRVFTRHRAVTRDSSRVLFVATGSRNCARREDTRKVFGLLEYALNQFFKVTLRASAGQLAYDLAILEHQDGRNRPDAIGAGGLGGLVDVDLDDLELVAVVVCDFFDDRSDRFTRSAPFRPEVDEHGSCGLEDLVLEGRVGHIADFGHFDSPSFIECAPRG